jgi:hypothetical protein
VKDTRLARELKRAAKKKGASAYAYHSKTPSLGGSATYRSKTPSLPKGLPRPGSLEPKLGDPG